MTRRLQERQQMSQATKTPTQLPILSFQDAERELVSAFARSARLFRRRVGVVAERRVVLTRTAAADVSRGTS